jgi:hypothetical protein
MVEALIWHPGRTCVPSRMALISFYSVPSSASFTVGLAYWLRMLGVCSIGHRYQSFTHGTSAHHHAEEMCPLVTCDYSFSPSRALVQPSVPFLFRSAAEVGAREAGNVVLVPKSKSVPRKPGSRCQSRCSGSRCPDIDFELPTDRPTDFPCLPLASAFEF